jgi:hypothetical protein
MDEIIIDDKKYVSSKQAAKITGYAKDYVGQLCREGRVTARLVGRSWYVLESAIQDHRFGKPSPKEEPDINYIATPAISSAWESPRYEPVQNEFLPAVQRTEEPVDAVFVAPEVVEELSITKVEHLEVEEEGVPEEPVMITKQRDLQEIAEIEEVVVVTTSEQQLTKQRRSRSRPIFRRLLSIVFMLAGLFSVGVTLLNSGYVDKYIVSVDRAQLFTGINVYKK